MSILTLEQLNTLPLAEAAAKIRNWGVEDSEEDMAIPVWAGVIPLALHPAMSFTGTSIDVHRLTDCYVAVTAPTPVLPIGQALAVELGAEPIVVPEAKRAAYAEAIATASEFSAAIVAQASGLLADIGVERPGRILAPLIRSAVDNALAAQGDASRLLYTDVEDDLS